jgi:hypothetical protein
MAMRPVTVNDILDGHVALDLQCLDRVYLNGRVMALAGALCASIHAVGGFTSRGLRAHVAA